MTPALWIFAVTVALAAGGLIVIAALCLIRGWLEHTPQPHGHDSGVSYCFTCCEDWPCPAEQQEWVDV